jgi:hypothetical protein
MSKSAKPPAAQPPPSSSSQLYRVTFEGAILAAVSNILAQSFSYYEKGPSALDPLTFFHFVLLAIITTPPNFKWQMWLENTFPGKKSPATKKEEKVDDKLGVNGSATVRKAEESLGGLSIKNTLAKFCLDQTVGAAGNTLWFIVMINLLRGNSLKFIVETIRKVSSTHHFMHTVIQPADANLCAGLLPNDLRRLQVLATSHNHESCFGAS